MNTADTLDARRQAAEAGLSEAYVNLATMYENGLGVMADETLARQFLARSRAEGARSLESALAETGFPFDGRLAAPDFDAPPPKLERRAAAAGDPVALYTMAFRLYTGAGVSANVPLASRLMEEAARSGLASAQLNLGLAYAQGLGVPQNYETAYYWLSRAANAGAPYAPDFCTPSPS